MDAHGVFGVNIDSQVPMGALGEALLAAEGITIIPQLLRYLGRVVYCPGDMGDARTMLCQEFGLSGTWSGL
jgi:hypothetical protein